MEIDIHGEIDIHLFEFGISTGYLTNAVSI